MIIIGAQRTSEQDLLIVQLQLVVAYSWADNLQPANLKLHYVADLQQMVLRYTVNQEIFVQKSFVVLRVYVN